MIRTYDTKCDVSKYVITIVWKDNLNKSYDGNRQYSKEQTKYYVVYLGKNQDKYQGKIEIQANITEILFEKRSVLDQNMDFKT